MLFYYNSFKGIDFVVFALAYLLVIILSLSLHEFAHAYSAYKCGDNTPKAMGRVNLNPFRHIDAIGIICCALFGFGWARPVQIQPSNFRNVKKGTVWTSIAGVLTNFILSFLGYGFYCLTGLISINNYFILFLRLFFYAMYFINLSLAIFNFLPIYPLDGFKLVEALTKYDNPYVNFMYKYGNLILVLLIVFFDNILIKLMSLLSYPILWFWSFIF